MKRKPIRAFALLIALTLAFAALSGCGKEPEKTLHGAAANDILTFTPNPENKPVIRIAMQYYTPDTSLLDTLQAKFPEYLFVFDYSVAAGVNSEIPLMQGLRDGKMYYDLVISGALGTATVQQTDVFVDLSAEGFLDGYLLSALNSVSKDGHIFMLPGTSTLSGIAFNAGMFREHGWEIPETHDEFFALCEEIKAAGITPFSTCFKYVSQVSRLLTMMCYAELFGTPEGARWIDAVQRNEADYKGFYEPVFEVTKRLVDAGLIPEEYITASLTQQRKDFWAGKTAMIEYDSAIFTYLEAENVTIDLGIMPYPSREAGNAGFAVMPEYYLYIPKCVEKDAERLAFMKEVLAYLSSEEGQRAMLAGSLRVSNIKNMSVIDNPAAKYAEEAIARGNLYPVILFNESTVPNVPYMGVMLDATRMFYEGATVEDAIAHADEAIDAAFAAAPTATQAPAPAVIAKAEAPFTMLETSYYIADKLREASGAFFGLMINGGYFRSNLASISQGDITDDMSPFVMKSVTGNDYMTTYRMTGAQIKAMLEHPIVNGAEVDALVAASGLAIEYAPWNERGKRVQKLTLADGRPLEDDTTYTVAAWAGVVDNAYITETVTTHEEFGTLSDLVKAGFIQDKTIKPDIANRVKLIWPKAK